MIHIMPLLRLGEMCKGADIGALFLFCLDTCRTKTDLTPIVNFVLLRRGFSSNHKPG